MDWIIPIAILGFLGVFIVAKIFEVKNKTDPVKLADEEAKAIRLASSRSLKKHLERVEKDKRRLEHIKKIEDDTERLKALATFGNR